MLSIILGVWLIWDGISQCRQALKNGTFDDQSEQTSGTHQEDWTNGPVMFWVGFSSRASMIPCGVGIIYMGAVLLLRST